MTTLLPTSLTHFRDPRLQEAVGRMGAYNKCSYLMPLAAWQRGLTVEFFGTQTAARVKIDNMPQSVERPELFRITDGARQHIFHMSMGDGTTYEIGQLAKMKHQAKLRFAKAGVPTPDFVLWNGGNIPQVRAFLARYPGWSFVIKPAVGSNRMGVEVGLPASQVLARLSRIGPLACLVEVQIHGLEHRVTVVGDRAIAAHVKPGVSVIGNGRDSIAELIRVKNARRAANPAIASCQIDLFASGRHLAGIGQTVARVPVLGERVVLSVSNNMGDGGDAFSVKGELEPAVAEAAVKAAMSLGVPNAALDLIFDGKRAWVLEANVKAMIAGHSFPTEGEGSGNVVAEAIVDWYFPTPDGQPPQRHQRFFDNRRFLEIFERDGAQGHAILSPEEYGLE